MARRPQPILVGMFWALSLEALAACLIIAAVCLLPQPIIAGLIGATTLALGIVLVWLLLAVER
jgi:hypothetical protein